MEHTFALCHVSCNCVGAHWLWLLRIVSLEPPCLACSGHSRNINERGERDGASVSLLLCQGFAYGCLPGLNTKIFKTSIDRGDKGGVTVLLQQKEYLWMCHGLNLFFTSNASLGCVTCHLSGSVIGRESRTLLSSKRNKSEVNLS